VTRRHVVTKRWEDETGARAVCSCGQEFAETDWIERAVAIADHRKEAKRRGEAPAHRPAVVDVQGGWVYLRCAECGWTAVHRSFEAAGGAARAHRRKVTSERQPVSS
jgi:hypothetical protein